MYPLHRRRRILSIVFVLIKFQAKCFSFAPELKNMRLLAGVEGTCVRCINESSFERYMFRGDQ